MNLDRYRDEVPPHREILEGGAVLLSHPLVNAHSTALGVWMRTGPEDEPASRGGLSHFLEHIVFKGSQTRSALEIAAGFDSLGATVDAFTTKDLVAFTIRVLPEYFAPACDLLADMLLRPAFAAEMVALEKEVVCQEIQEAYDTPEDRLHDAFAARVYGRHPRSRPILGSQESVRALDEAILRQEHQRLMVGPNVVVALAGNIPPGAREVVHRCFSFPAAGVDGERSSADRERGELSTPPSGRNGRLRLEGPVLQSYFEIGNLGVPLLHDDRIPVFVLSNLLGGGMSSRVYQAVREREGLAYTVFNYCDMGREVGLVSCAGSCSPANSLRLEEVVRLEYRRLLAEGIDHQELANNQAQIKSQLIFTLEGVQNQMYRVARNEINFGRFLPVEELVASIDAVDRDVIGRCAELYFHPDRLTVATHGPA